MNFSLLLKTIGSVSLALIILAGSYPANASVGAETAYVFNTFSFLIHGILVMFMAAGFAMLESGLVRSKNTATICLKNIALYSLAGIAFYLVGYNLMYTDVPKGGFMGAISLLYNPSADELTLLRSQINFRQARGSSQTVSNDGTAKRGNRRGGGGGLNIPPPVCGPTRPGSGG